MELFLRGKYGLSKYGKVMSTGSELWCRDVRVARWESGKVVLLVEDIHPWVAKRVQVLKQVMATKQHEEQRA